MLTLEQRAELVQLRQLYLSKLHVIMDQRREALKSMHESMLVLPLAAGERISAVQYLKVSKLSYAGPINDLPALWPS